MLLADFELEAAVKAGQLGIDPFEPELLQPSSIDVRLDWRFLEWPERSGGSHGHDRVVDPAVEPNMVPVAVPHGDFYLLKPRQMVLAATLEHISVANGFAARLEGKSSIGRLGVAVHITAGFIDPGFSGHVTLELVNHNPDPVRLYPGMRIGQLCVFRMSAPAARPYGAAGVGSHYQGQRGPTPSRSHVGWRT